MIDSASRTQKVLDNMDTCVKSEKVTKDQMSHDKMTQGTSLNQLPVVKFRTIWPLKRIVIITDYNILSKHSLVHSETQNEKEGGLFLKSSL